VNTGIELDFVYEAVGCAYPPRDIETDDALVGFAVAIAADDTNDDDAWLLQLVYE